MKLLFVSTNSEHPNTMHINFNHALAECAEVSFYGPGYSGKEELEKGLFYFWKEKGGFDAIILDYWLAMLKSEYLNIREAYHWHRYLQSDYNIYEAIRYVDDIVDDIDKIDTVKLLLFRLDSFSITESDEQCLRFFLNKGYYHVGHGEDFYPEITSASMKRDWRLSNRYLYYLRDYKERIISIPMQAASYDEYFVSDLCNREYDWVVPGNLASYFYPSRGMILDELRKSEYKVYDDFYNRTAAYGRGSERIRDSIYRREVDKNLDIMLKNRSPYLDARVQREAIALWRENYNVALRKTKIAYADGGIVQQLFKKILEIPSRGTLMACKDMPVLSKLGFVDRENMILVTPENVLDISRELFCNPKEMQRIADNGRKLVYEKHTSKMRAKNLIDAIWAIAKNDFYGSYWKNGDFVIVTRELIEE